MTHRGGRNIIVLTFFNKQVSWYFSVFVNLNFYMSLRVFFIFNVVLCSFNYVSQI